MEGGTQLFLVINVWLDGAGQYEHKYFPMYLKGTIVCEYYFFAIFATGGKNAKLSTRNYLIVSWKIWK